MHFIYFKILIKAVREKRVVRVIRIYYKETEKYVYIRILRDGGCFTNESTKIGENLK